MKNSIPTLDLGLEPAEEGRSVGSFRPKIFFAAFRAAVGRSVFTESETQKPHFLSRSVGDAELTFNFAPPYYCYCFLLWLVDCGHCSAGATLCCSGGPTGVARRVATWSMSRFQPNPITCLQLPSCSQRCD